MHRFLRLYLSLLLAALFSFGFCFPALANSDIVLTVSNPDLDPAGDNLPATMLNTVLSSPSVAFGENRELGTLRMVGQTGVKNPVLPGKKVKVSLPVGLCYMQTPTAENYRHYVQWPETLDGYLKNQICDDGEKAGMKFIAGTPRSITLEVQNLNPGYDMAVVDFVFNQDDFSKVKVSQLIEAPEKYKGKESKPISRAEFLSLLSDITLAFPSCPVKITENDQPLSDLLADISDIDASVLAKIKPLIDTGIIPGSSSPEELKLNQDITRAEAVSLIGKILPVKPADVSFADPIPDWAETAVRSVTAYGIIAGYPDGTFRPEASLTHQEAIDILQKVLESFEIVS